MHPVPRAVALLIVLGAAAPAQQDRPRTDRLGDPLPRGALARLGAARLRHASFVNGGRKIVGALSHQVALPVSTCSVVRTSSSVVRITWATTSSAGQDPSRGALNRPTPPSMAATIPCCASSRCETFISRPSVWVVADGADLRRPRPPAGEGAFPARPTGVA